MKLIDVKISRLIPGSAAEVFDVWFDPQSPGGPWHGAKKVLMNLAVDGLFYFGIEHAGGLKGHFGRFVAVDRPRAVEHTWMSVHTHGLETSVLVTFEARKGGTELTLAHRGLPDDEDGRLHEGGWTQLLARLEKQFPRR
jgi:uncharacterized protein YndB with AHSA1/START domain